MVAVGKILIAASLTGTLAVGAIAWNGSDNLQVVKSYAISMKEKVVSLASDIGFLNQTVTDKNTQINNQKGRIAELEGTINQLTTERDALQAEVDRLSADNARIPELEAQIQTLNTRISVLEGQVSELQASLSSLQADYDNTVAELEKANGEITKANQESQELKDYAANLETESTSAYNDAKVDRNNPMYEVEDFPTLEGLHWSNPGLAISDGRTTNVIKEIMKTELYYMESNVNAPGDIFVHIQGMPVHDDGNLDALMEFLLKNTDIVTNPSVYNINFIVRDSNDTNIGGYRIHVDNTTGQYVVDRTFK